MHLAWTCRILSGAEISNYLLPEKDLKSNSKLEGKCIGTFYLFIFLLIYISFIYLIYFIIILLIYISFISIHYGEYFKSSKIWQMDLIQNIC